MSDDTQPKFDLPLWAVEETAAANRSWFPRSIGMAATREGHPALPLFSDEHLAERFIEETHGKPARPRRIDTPADLDILLHFALARGYRLVAYDVPPANRPNERGWTFDTAKLIADCFAQF